MGYSHWPPSSTCFGWISTERHQAARSSCGRSSPRYISHRTQSSHFSGTERRVTSCTDGNHPCKKNINSAVPPPKKRRNRVSHFFPQSMVTNGPSSAFSLPFVRCEGDLSNISLHLGCWSQLKKKIETGETKTCTVRIWLKINRKSHWPWRNLPLNWALSSHLFFTLGRRLTHSAPRYRNDPWRLRINWLTGYSIYL